MAGLKEWFKQDWVDIGSKKKGGGFNKCGRKFFLFLAGILSCRLII